MSIIHSTIGLEVSSEIDFWAIKLQSLWVRIYKGNLIVYCGVHNRPIFSYNLSKEALWKRLWFSWRVCIKIFAFWGTKVFQNLVTSVLWSTLDTLMWTELYVVFCQCKKPLITLVKWLMQFLRFIFAPVFGGHLRLNKRAISHTLKIIIFVCLLKQLVQLFCLKLKALPSIQNLSRYSYIALWD